MSTTKESLLDRNRDQVVSEADDFTVERYRQMFRHLPPDATRVLDAGCNTGRGGAVLKALNARLQITGLDCVPERMTQLDSTVYSDKICGFSTQLPSPDGSFDAVIAGEFIEHVPPGDVDPTLVEFFRVLRLRGRLIMTTPNPGYLKNKLRHLSVLLEPSHLTQHYPDCLRRRLRAIGYSGVTIRGSGRMTRYLGSCFPMRSIYGSYLVRADKW